MSGHRNQGSCGSEPLSNVCQSRLRVRVTGAASKTREPPVASPGHLNHRSGGCPTLSSPGNLTGHRCWGTSTQCEVSAGIKAWSTRPPLLVTRSDCHVPPRLEWGAGCHLRQNSCLSESVTWRQEEIREPTCPRLPLTRVVSRAFPFSQARPPKKQEEERTQTGQQRGPVADTYMPGLHLNSLHA